MIAVIDIQSVKTTKKGPKGYDAGKKVKGRKRHLIVDSMGLLLTAVVHSAGLQDNRGGACGAALEALRSQHLPRLGLLRAGHGYRGSPVVWAQAPGGWKLQLTEHKRAQSFVTAGGRWVVERTFAWLGRYRRLSKDYEQNRRAASP